MPAVALVRCRLCGDDGYYRLDVVPGHPQFGVPQPCSCRREAAAAALHERARRASNLSGKLLGCTFANFDQVAGTGEMVTVMRAFAEEPQEPRGWVLLLGPPGVGKTHLMAAVANTLMQRGACPHPLYVVVPDWLEYVRAGINVTHSPVTGEDGVHERMAQAKQAGLLLLDDLGAQYRTGWSDERLFELLNHRYIAELPTVIASNLHPQQMEPRIASRLRDRRLVCEVVVVAEDYRSSQGGRG